MQRAGTTIWVRLVNERDVQESVVGGVAPYAYGHGA